MPSKLYIDTLAIGSLELVIMRLIKSWLVASTLGMFGFAKISASIRAKYYRKSGAFGAIIVQGNEPLDYIKAGRVMERVWLKATELDISLQPCVGVLYLWEGIMKSATTFFTQEEQHLVQESRNKILEVFDVQGKTIPMFFRMGYKKEKTTVIKSFRYEPEIDYISLQ